MLPVCCLSETKKTHINDSLKNNHHCMVVVCLIVSLFSSVYIPPIPLQIYSTDKRIWGEPHRIQRFDSREKKAARGRLKTGRPHIEQ